MAQLAAAKVTMADATTACRNRFRGPGRAFLLLVRLFLRIRDFVLLAMAGIVGEVVFEARTAHPVNKPRTIWPKMQSAAT
jgi:hypothetical protein